MYLIEWISRCFCFTLPALDWKEIHSHSILVASLNYSIRIPRLIVIRAETVGTARFHPTTDPFALSISFSFIGPAS